MSKLIFNPTNMMKPVGYSHVAKVTGGSLVYIAGQVSADVSGNLVGEGNLEAQADQVFKNLKTAVEAAGGTMADVAMNHIFLTDWADYGAINTVYAEYFPGDKPARYCVKASLVKQDALIEIASVAHVG